MTPGAPGAAVPPALPASPPWRALRNFALARVLLATVLLASVVIVAERPPAAPDGGFILPLTLGYFALACGLALITLGWQRQFAAQLSTQLAVDLVLITLMISAAGGFSGGIMAMYLLPLAGASVMLPTVPAFFVCSVAVLALLVESTLRMLSGAGADSSILQAGLYGAALFGITGLLRLLSMRLATQERLAQARGLGLQAQLEINRLVIAQMEQGVLVIDTNTRVLAHNRAARQMLGLAPAVQIVDMQLLDFEEARPLALAFLRWRPLTEPGAEYAGARALGDEHPMPEGRLRARFVRPTSPRGDDFVVFLEDVQQIEERAQQLKLASMGRLTASIAHEIRNPLAAISHASQLLSEESLDPLQRRLTGIVIENTNRLSRVVEDVLRVARREAPLGDEFELGPFVAGWLAEFERDRGIVAGRIVLAAAPALVVRFEHSHLRQVLFNLVDNALRYASSQPGAVRIFAECGKLRGASAQLSVFDDGPGIAPDVRSALFEPFNTSRVGGTGLGLYIAREFCIANQGDLVVDSRRDVDGSSRDGFTLRFGLGAPALSDGRGFLDTIPLS